MDISGKSESHLIDTGIGKNRLQKETFENYLLLKDAAFQAGFEMYIASSFRSYEAQLRIWNEKATGKRELMDREGNILEHGKLNDDQILESILHWSAIPGCSRHHWGTDLDVFDKSSCPENYHVMLTPDECNGIFRPFHQWLTEIIETNSSFGFYRPYEKDLGGVAPEPWHISYRPSSSECEKLFNFAFFEQMISNPKLELHYLIQARSNEIYNRFFD